MKIRDAKKTDVSHLSSSRCFVKKLSISKMYSTNVVQRSVELLEFGIKGVRPQCGQPSVNLRKSIHKSEKHVRKILGGTKLGP